MDVSTLQLVVSAIAAAAAVTAATMAIRSSRIAQKSLDLATRALDERSAGVALYLIENVKRRVADKELTAFALTFMNQAETSNSVVRVDLEVHYVLPNGTMTHLMFPIAGDAAALQELGELPRLSLPLNLAGRASTSGWLIYTVPFKELPGYIDRYRLRALTALGKISTVESYIVKTIFDEGEDYTS